MDLRAAGVPLTLEVAGCNTALVVAEVERVWARCLRSDGVPAAGVVRVVLDDDPTVVAAERAAGSVAYTELAHVMHEISPRVTDLALRLRAHDPVALLHAGGVCGEDGATVVLVGPSGAGKTTAVRRLSAHLGYVSDETIALAPDLSITPYPKPFSILDRGDHWKTQHAPDDLGVGVTPVSARAAAIVVLDRRADAAGVEVEELDVLEAMSILAPQIAFLAARRRPLQRLGATLEVLGPVLRVTYREAGDLLPLMEELIAAAPSGGPSGDLWREPEPVVTRDGGPWLPADYRDLYSVPDGRAALLLDEQFIALSPAAGEVIRAIAEGIGDQQTLQGRLMAATGAAEAGMTTLEWAVATTDLLSQLEAANLVIHAQDAPSDTSVMLR